MDKQTKRNVLLIAFAVVLFTLLMNLNGFIGFLAKFVKLVFPIVFGFSIAFILNVPMRGFEKLLKKLTNKLKKKPKAKTLRAVSFLLTLLSVLLVIAFVGILLVPELVNSVSGIYSAVKEKMPSWIEKIEAYGINTDNIAAWFENMKPDAVDAEKIISAVTSGAGSVISSTASILASTVSGTLSFLVSVVVAAYALLSKDELCRHSRILIDTHIKSPINEYIYKIASMINETYSKFLSGQCVEAVILGSLIFIFYRIFNIPYAGLIGIMTAIFAFIPYVGAFLSCGIGAFLVLLSSPEKVIIAIIVYLVIQFIETQFIYPHVVGSSVGLSPLWTLIAVFLGGKLMGVLGMIFFIPLTAVFFELIKGYTRHKQRMKKQTE